MLFTLFVLCISKMETILITGATGAIGRYLWPLCAQSYNVVCLTRHDVVEYLPKNVRFIKVDLFDSKAVENVVKIVNPDILFHLAGCSSVQNYQFSDLNYLFLTASINLVHFCLKNGCRKIINIGSSTEYKIYKNKNIYDENSEVDIEKNNYVFSKLIVNKVVKNLCEKYGASYTYCRVFNVIGIEDYNRLFGSIYYAIVNNLNFEIKNGNTILDFIYSKDVARMLYLIGIKNNIEGIINVCSGKGTKIKDMINELIKHAKQRGYVVASSFEIQEGEGTVVIGDISKLKRFNITANYSVSDIIDDII